MTLDLPIPARHDASANVEVTTMPLYKRGDVWWHTFRGWDGQRRRKSTGTRDKRTVSLRAEVRGDD